MARGQRARITPDLIEESEGFGTLTERLAAAERELSWRVSPIDRKGARVVLPDPLLAADLGLTTGQYEWLLNLLGEAIQGVIQYPQSLQKVVDHFPLVFIAGLTGSALLNTSESFWEDLRRRLGLRDSSRLEAIIRKDLHSILKRKKLATFTTANLSGRDYVGAIELHSILPNRYLSGVIGFLDDLDKRSSGPGNPEDTGRYAVQEFSHHARELGQPVAVHNLATHIPSRASEVFSRIEEIRALFRDPGSKAAEIEFEDTHGLPEPMFNTLLSQLTGEGGKGSETPPAVDTAGSTVELEEPYLFLDLELLEVRLGVPPIPRGLFHENDHPVWTLQLDDEIISISP